MHFPHAPGYTGVRRARRRGPEAVAQRPNELVELAEVPGAEARIVREVWILAEATPGRWGQNVHVIHRALYNIPKWSKSAFGKVLIPATIRMRIK